MIGHLQIIRARKDRLKPSIVCIDIGLPVVAANFDFEQPEKALDYNLYPTIYLEAEEAGQRHDWRFLTGCRVHVVALQITDEVTWTVEQIAQAGASGVVACALDDGELLMFLNGEWSAHASPAA